MELIREKLLAVTLIIVIAFFLLVSRRRNHGTTHAIQRIELTVRTADRLLAEEIIITTAATDIRKNTQYPNPAAFHWGNIPILLMRLKHYCLDHNLKLITLRQIRFNLIHIAIACNYRDSMDPVDKLMNHLSKVMRENEVDEATAINIYRVVDGILQYVRVPNLPHAAG